VKNYIFIL